MGCERAIVVRVSCEFSGIYRPSRATRPNSILGSATRRPPLPRIPNTHQKNIRRLQVLRIDALPPRRRNRPDRLRCHGTQCRTLPPQDDRRRSIRLLPPHRLRTHPADRRQGGCLRSSRHGTHLRTRGGTGHSVVFPLGGCCYHHHPQESSWTTWCDDILPQGPEGHYEKG